MACLYDSKKYSTKINVRSRSFFRFHTQYLGGLASHSDEQTELTQASSYVEQVLQWAPYPVESAELTRARCSASCFVMQVILPSMSSCLASHYVQQAELTQGPSLVGQLFCRRSKADTVELLFRAACFVVQCYIICDCCDLTGYPKTCSLSLQFQNFLKIKSREVDNVLTPVTT